MLLTPTEYERLTLYTAAELARRHRHKGLRLNHPEAVAIIADEILEGAREGRMVADLIAFGSTVLTQDDVLPGVAEMLPMLQVEGSFPDGTKLVTIHQPIRPGKLAPTAGDVVPGEILAAEGTIELNVNRQTAVVKAMNTGDRPTDRKPFPFLRGEQSAPIRPGGSVRHAPGHSRGHRGPLRTR
jgi:urease subunit gamma/beta